MSRRTKLILAALFLILLAIPAVYVILTWSTPNPLRFRVVGYEEPSRVGQFRDSGKLHMIVENTSGVPVHFEWATLKKGHNATGTSDPFGGDWSVYGLDGRNDMIIPPYSSLPCFSTVPQDEYPASAFENIELFYTWMSGTRAKASEARNWLYLHAPEFVRSYITMDWPSHDQDTTPLLPALSGQGQPQSSRP
ncbi:MAG: hypothetical protein ACAH88_14410 [Roseimicrobium sp.]